MGQINLYRIDIEKSQAFLQEINQKLIITNTILIDRTVDGQDRQIGFTLYISPAQEESDIDWNWVLTTFGQEEQKSMPSPKAIILVEKDEAFYAITFGRSYFLVDKFCDSDFGFKFARRIDFQEIKTTALTSPSSKRNKVINTYINYNELEFDSGESFAKIKAKTPLPEGFTIYKNAIEIGGSIKFTIENDNLDAIADLILHVEYVIEHEDVKYEIPLFSKVTDKNLIELLNKKLEDDIASNPLQLSFSEMDIVGTTEVFRNTDAVFGVIHKAKSKMLNNLTHDEIVSFCSENAFDYAQEVLDIRVISYLNGEKVDTKPIRGIIDYTNDAERCILSKGQWFKFNDDYLSYLHASLSEIDVQYNPTNNFLKAQHRAFQERKFNEEKEDARYRGKSIQSIRESINRRYYAERCFNVLQEEENGYQNHDRTEQRIGSADIELMDLYKEGAMFAVKIGDSSAKLCYAVDQSISSLKAYKHRLLPSMPDVRTIGLWLILDRATMLPMVEGRPDINALDMLMLKNRLDHWKKEVRLAGYKPLIYINYVVN